MFVKDWDLDVWIEEVRADILTTVELTHDIEVNEDFLTHEDVSLELTNIGYFDEKHKDWEIDEKEFGNTYTMLVHRVEKKVSLV